MSAWTTVKKTGKTMSSALGLTGLEAYCIDEVVVYWGTSFEADLAKAVNETKDDKGRERAAKRIIRRWIPSQRLR